MAIFSFKKIVHSMSSLVTGILEKVPFNRDDSSKWRNKKQKKTGAMEPEYPSDPRILNLIFETKARIEAESGAPSEDLLELLEQVRDVLRVRSVLRYSHPAKIDHSSYQS